MLLVEWQDPDVQGSPRANYQRSLVPMYYSARDVGGRQLPGSLLAVSLMWSKVSFQPSPVG